MERLKRIKREMRSALGTEWKNQRNLILLQGYQKRYNLSPILAKAEAKAELFRSVPKKIYENDLIVGSIGGLYAESLHEAELAHAEEICESYGVNNFLLNADHFTPDFAYCLEEGIGGVLADIDRALSVHREDASKQEFLQACRICMEGLSDLFLGYAKEAECVGKPDEASICRKLSKEKPESFREALQLVWMIHLSFLLEGRYAMALGRMDQYLFPFYRKDLQEGRLTAEEAEEMIACTLIKIDERRIFEACEDVVNICIGGEKREGGRAFNDLTLLILDAVKVCGISGPNLSARVCAKDSDAYLDACLEVIGSGIGYPSLINDDVNIPALQKYGYDIEDCRDYSMVGCIESFLTGKMPPWTDGRFNLPQKLEYALNGGHSQIHGGKLGKETDRTIDSMESLLAEMREQIAFGMEEYARLFRNRNNSVNPRLFAQPYLSCFCRACIERGLDIREGGTVYPSAHGIGLVGIATAADSLAAINELVFRRRELTLAELAEALRADFRGYEELQRKLLAIPKYGNHNDLPDRYAVWLLDTCAEFANTLRTRDGGPFFLAMASNIQNISEGSLVGATADGRNSRVPLSDAASPMRGQDKNGLTALFSSVAKPDYTHCACGTVLNLKFTGDFFNDQKKREKLKSAIRVYLKLGGQEVQINNVSREKLEDAMEHPEEYEDLVVRVSGFSAFYTRLDKAVQKDILERTECSE